MKFNVKKMILMAFISAVSLTVMAQENDNMYNDVYCRQNIAFSDFRLLGVSNSQFAKCVTAKNYQDAALKIKMVTIEGVDFVDTGEGYDLAANDGILTSKTTFNYESGQQNTEIGQYKDVKGVGIVFDNSFAHISKVPGAEGKLSVACNFSWVNCNSWPPAYQSICNSITWPFSGYLNISNCRITWTS